MIRLTILLLAMAGTVQANCLDVKVPGVKLMSLPLPLKTVHGFTVTKMLCHKDMEIPLTKAFACVKLAGLEKEIQNTGGCFCYRNIAGTNRLSKHAQGSAISKPQSNISRSLTAEFTHPLGSVIV